MIRPPNHVNRPIRILHVVKTMNRGGIETWLMHVLRHIDRERFQMDFLVQTSQPGAFDEEIRSLGSEIIPCLHHRRPYTFARNLKEVLREYGPYDVIHSHVHHYSGWILRVARQFDVPVRIAHSHNDTSSLQAKARFLRRRYLAITKRWIARHATLGLAASGKAAAALFGPAWKSDPRWRILYYGIDLDLFREPVHRIAVRAELGISVDALVVGHVGSFTHQKNHTFLLEIAAEVVKREPNARLLLIGDGPLRPAVERQVARIGLSDCVIFTGVRPDVRRLMLGAMDVFLLSSFWEGLPLVGIEAQAAGLPSVLSNVITEELDIARPLVRRLSLSEPASAWAEVVLRCRDHTLALKRPEALAAVECSRFNIRTGVKELETLYNGASRLRAEVYVGATGRRPSGDSRAGQQIGCNW